MSGNCINRLLAFVLLTTATPASGPAQEVLPAATADLSAILEDAMQKRTALDTLRYYTMTVKSEEGNRSHTRRAAMATKEFDGVLYVLGIFSHPPDLRGTSFLTINDPPRSEYFVYFPAFGRIRRVSTPLQSDPWFGTDLSIEDIERHEAADFEILASERTELRKEPVHRISARPTYGSSYALVTFFIAETDHAILQTEYVREGRELPSKVIQADREGMLARDGVLIPQRIICTNLDTRTQTEVHVDEVIFSPDLQRQFFSTAKLALRSKLRFLD